MEIKERIENIKIDYDFDRVYTELKNTCIDYMNESQDFSLDYCFDNFTDREIVAIELENLAREKDLERIHYYINDTDLREDIFIIDNYGNLNNVTIEDLQELKQNIIEELEELEEIEELEENEQ